MLLRFVREPASLHCPHYVLKSPNMTQSDVAPRKRCAAGRHMRRTSLFLVLRLALAGAAAMLHAQQPSPDVILRNGKIFTVDERFTIAQAVAISAGRFAAVGANQ